MKKSRTLSVLCFSVLSLRMWAQSPAPAAEEPAAQSSGNSDLNELRNQIIKQEEEIKRLQESVEKQRALLDQALKESQAHAAQNAAAATPAAQPASATEPAKTVPLVNVARTANRSGQHPELQPSPLSLSIGNATFTPLGFVDATFFARSTNVGSGIGTNFAGIPFNSAASGHLSETNFSAQNSRIGLRVDSQFLGWKVLGYLETDFLFNNNANSFQIGSNSAALRLRNYFVDVNDGKFEVLAGQAWSMLTPNRKGLSPLPSDIFYSQAQDTNYQLGLIWTRAPQFRFIAHPNENISFGIALENPQQYLGGANGSAASTLPNNLSGVIGQFQYSPALSLANSITNVPNLMPDVQAKVAFDGDPQGRHMHVEAAGFVSGYKDYIPATVKGAVFGSHDAFGGGAEINSNLEIFKNFRLIENAFVSDGGGRYVFGQAPDLIVRPDGTLSLLKAASTVDGFEAQVKPNTLISVLYGGTYVGRNVAYDPSALSKTAAAAFSPVGTATPLLVGYGYPGIPGYGAANSGQNRTVQELTFDWVQTLWKNKNYGSLSLINQYSYVLRSPWAVTSGAPKQAHTNMVWVNLRYTLP